MGLEERGRKDMRNGSVRGRGPGKRLTAFLLMLMLIVGLPGCGTGTASAVETGDLLKEVLADGVTVEYKSEELDDSWQEDQAVIVSLTGDGGTVSTAASASDAEGASGAVFSGSTLTIGKGGTYVLRGSLSDGQVIVDAGKEDQVHLVLDGVNLTCAHSAPLYVKQADRVIVTLAEGSVNAITDGAEYVFEEGEDEPSAALFSKDDLAINGSGTLSVTGNYNNGITSKDDLVIAGGTLSVTAVGDGIRGKDSVAIRDGSLTIVAGEDGIKSNNDTDETKGFVVLDGGSVVIRAGSDGIQAETTLQMNGGTVELRTGEGSESQETKASARGGQDTAGRGGMMGEWGPGGPGGREISGSGIAPGGMAGQPPELPDWQRKGAAGLEAGVSGAAVEAVSGGAVSGETESDSRKGLKAGRALIISGGSINADCFDDALHSNGNGAVLDGELTLSTGDDGIHADNILVIAGGSVNIARSYEGLEGAEVLISGGNIRLTSTDDGVNAAGGSDGSAPASSGGAVREAGQDSFAQRTDNRIHITGGTLWVSAQGDGLDSNGDLVVDGGTILIDGPTGNGDGALDCDGELTVNGGLLIAAGSAGMPQMPDESSSQSALMVRFTETQSGGTLFRLETVDGEEILTYAPSKEYQTVIVSSPDLRQGETFRILSGGTHSGTVTDGLYDGGSYSGGTERTTVTLQKTVSAFTDTGEETSTGMGGFSGGPRGGGRGAMDGAPPEGTRDKQQPPAN